MVRSKAWLAVVTLALAPACGQLVEVDSTAAALSSHGHRLKGTDNGNDKGWVDVDSLADGYAGLSVHITAVLKHGLPGAAYLLQRAPEPPGGALWPSPNGTCERAAGGDFLTFALAGVNVTINTDEEGNGSVEFDFRTPPGPPFPFPDGSTFDVAFRAVDSVTAPSSDLRSDCFEVDVL